MSLFQAFTVIKLLRKFQCVHPSNTSYMQVLSHKMNALKSLLHIDEFKVETIEDNSEALLHNLT